MAIESSALVGGVTSNKSYTGALSIAAGASGTYITIPAVTGQRARLDLLATQTGNDTGTTIQVNGVDVITSLNLKDSGTNVVGDFNIGAAVGSLTVRQHAGTLPYILAGVNESITVIKDTGSTAQIQWYSYSYLK